CTSLVAEFGCFNPGRKSKNRSFRIYRETLSRFRAASQREIELLYENAVRESNRIINSAENKAETIGGDAYRSLREADEIASRIQSHEKRY
ncbi:hypothetical protein, partial [Chryseobacterium indoltheticum]|uniref:hypothetical protein n=1 Tax=Chryseobacterium indoltheticum TaxID=254 RepID=UPI003F4980A5